MQKGLILTGTFQNDDAAKAAISSLERAGKKRDEIAALFADRSMGLAFRVRQHTKASEGIALGASIGALICGAICCLIALNDSSTAFLFSIATLHPFIASLTGVGAGGLIGGLIGGIIGYKIPEHEARVTYGNVKSGNILLAVTASPNQRDELMHVLRSTGGKHLTSADQKFDKESDQRGYAIGSPLEETRST